MTTAKFLRIPAGLAAVLLSWGLGISAAEAETLTIYSGRSEQLIGPLIEKAREELDLDIEVRYGDTAELAIAILEEGENSPADIFFGQDAGSLGALAQEERTLELPNRLLLQVDERFRSPEAQWIGISGRARVVDYNTDLVEASDLPSSVWDLTEPQWRGKVGWAPTNGSFQAFVTALRLIEGDERALEWLEAMKANGAVEFPNNSGIVEALGRGEIALGMVNNYYLYRFLAENPEFPVAHHYTRGDAGSMVNVAGAAILDTTDQRADAERLVEYLLSPESQQFFAEETKEYPLVTGVEPPEEQIPLSQINTPEIDLSNLADLEGTLELLQEAGVL